MRAQLASESKILTATYDSEVDAAYVYLSNGRVENTEEIEAGFLVDVDRDGKIVGFEFLDASGRFSEATLKAFKQIARSERGGRK